MGGERARNDADGWGATVLVGGSDVVAFPGSAAMEALASLVQADGSPPAVHAPAIRCGVLVEGAVTREGACAWRVGSPTIRLGHAMTRSARSARPLPWRVPMPPYHLTLTLTIAGAAIAIAALTALIHPHASRFMREGRARRASRSAEDNPALAALRATLNDAHDHLCVRWTLVPRERSAVDPRARSGDASTAPTPVAATAWRTECLACPGLEDGSYRGVRVTLGADGLIAAIDDPHDLLRGMCRAQYVVMDHPTDGANGSANAGDLGVIVPFPSRVEGGDRPA